MKRFTNDNNNKRIYLYIFIVFLLVTLIELLIFLPKIKSAIKESNVIELIDEHKNKQEESNSREYNLFFVSMDEEIDSFSYIGTKRYNLIHDSFEYQLKTPPLIALDDYYVSLIPENTKLIGVSRLARKAIYLDVSKEILNSKNFSLCYDQLYYQAKEIDSEAKFFLLIEGNLYNRDKELVKKYS